MRVNQLLWATAKEHDMRLVKIAFQSAKKTEVEFEGCVLIEDADELTEIFNRIWALTQKAEDVIKKAKARKSKARTARKG